jgi:hypothetical protein
MPAAAFGVHEAEIVPFVRAEMSPVGEMMLVSLLFEAANQLIHSREQPGS